MASMGMKPIAEISKSLNSKGKGKGLGDEPIHVKNKNRENGLHIGPEPNQGKNKNKNNGMQAMDWAIGQRSNSCRSTVITFDGER